MALDGPAYYSNSIQGIPGAGADVNIYDTHSTPKYALGWLIERADGSRFRYCQFGGAVNAGTLVGPTTSSAGATYGAITVVAPASAVAVPAEYPILPGQAGSHYVEGTISSIAANKYEGGYLIVTRGTGVGDTYRIVGNTATNDPVTGNLRIQLAEPLKVSITVGTGTIVVGSMYTDLALCAISSTQVTGVLMATTTSTLIYAWVCTRGVVGCQEEATVAPVAGAQISPSRLTAGAYQTMVAGAATIGGAFFSVPLIGYCRTPSGTGAAANRQGVIYLEIE